jgi:NitT/TauT family transport system permease protein
MACEMFVLGQRDFRLPGLGSYLQTAANAGDVRAIVWGMATMIGVIVLMDLVVWRPVIAWADKFKFEQVESASAPHSAVLPLLRHSKAFGALRRKILFPLRENALLHFARRPAAFPTSQPLRWKPWIARAFVVIGLTAIAYGALRAVHLVLGLGGSELRILVESAGATFLRVFIALVLGAAWTIPAGVAIGFHPRLARFAQPLAQIAASVPATALFPVVLLLLIRAGGGMQVGSIALMLLGTQWYILFNVIAGAMAIPTDLKECSSVFRLGRWERWRLLILLGIFPYLVTGLVTAAGGAWNASIVAEYFHFRGQTLSVVGLGATISQATDEGHFDLLLAATIVMAVTVVFINRMVWHRLYRLASTRFKLET